MSSTFYLDITWKTRQVFNVFQEPVEQPLLGFRIAEVKPDRLNIIKLSRGEIFVWQISRPPWE